MYEPASEVIDSQYSRVWSGYLFVAEGYKLLADLLEALLVLLVLNMLSEDGASLNSASCQRRQGLSM